MQISFAVSIGDAVHVALCEASETSVQTQEEESRGDLQTQCLLKRQQAAKGPQCNRHQLHRGCRDCGFKALSGRPAEQMCI